MKAFCQYCHGTMVDDVCRRCGQPSESADVIPLRVIRSTKDDHDAEELIAIEYVGGQTVLALRKQRGPFPVTEAISYILKMLPLFSTLHAQGFVFVDFTPENMVVDAGEVKLIDRGTVYKIGDPQGDRYVTKGFAAPEARKVTRAASDLYSIGRVLAVLVMDFDVASEFEFTLPSPEEALVLAENASFYRFLLRATHIDPDRRFQTAEEMTEQLLGVSRELFAFHTPMAPVESKLFTGDRLVHATARELVTQCQPLALPSPRMNMNDPAAGEVICILMLMHAEDQLSELQSLVAKHGDRAIEPRLRLVELLITHPELLSDERDRIIDKALSDIFEADSLDWRVDWYRGVVLMMRGEGEAALRYIDRCYSAFPGELAPRLAMGLAAEIASDVEVALMYYDRVGRVDPGFVSAHTGGARCLAQLGRLQEAIDFLQRVPVSHALYSQVQLSVGELLLAYPHSVDLNVMQIAESVMRSIFGRGGSVFQMTGRLMTLLVERTKSTTWPCEKTFLGVEYSEYALRLAAEKQFRQAAKLASSQAERHYWVDHANRVRPVSIW